MLGNDKAIVMDMSEIVDSLHQRFTSILRAITAGFVVAAAALTPLTGNAADALIGGKFAEVGISGGADTINPGTSCVKLDVSLPAMPSCVGGWIAIPNNNSKLVNAALAAKSMNRPVALYLAIDLPAAQALHCPALAFTRCSLISIIVQ